MTVYYIAVLILLMMAGAYIGIVRNFTCRKVSAENLNTWLDMDWPSCSHLDRLLDPAEFEFLRKRGLSEKRIREFRAARRGIFRIYLRQLTNQFSAAQSTLKMILVSAGVDRPDLAR